ncbi:hypothetical protein LOZ53_006415 [Ophidiomyces ophidiicola]|nr:hypothetical protein LOZ55_006655 [Ophidiomyces ophidiicola]KAI1980204.1 hypothetical protein LOZ54_005901 [Ophidiomyces ophidiicola]KAI1981744.1 hypothetical protein LOZ53_006415 [Ophidiomyces ophidiicola]KAI1983632.1 hypothetical protein LOZ51_006857 [Ophidiomyces ophidiicola]
MGQIGVGRAPLLRRRTFLPTSKLKSHVCRSLGGCLAAPERELSFYSVSTIVSVTDMAVCAHLSRYHESIHFLYSANTFSIEPNYFPPFSDVKRLFPSHCLSAVRSLELLYPVATYRDLPVLDRFTSTIAHIPLIFPHLRSFHIAISSWWMLCALEHWENFAADHSELVKSELLGTLDGLVRCFNGQLRDCELTVDPNYYEIVKVLEDDRTGPAEVSMFNWSKKTLTKRHWRQLDEETDSMKSKLGYWIVMAC